jgi:tRNA-uridine 2-sulfurtransferase
MYFRFMKKCLVMFSGGLDSAIAIHLLKQQGIDVLALHFILPFYSDMGRAHEDIKSKAAVLGVPIRIVEEGAEYLPIFKDPVFGYGKHANPCMDCRIHRLTRAAAVMREEGAAFIATGEVVGQRPMSQRRDCLDIIEKRTGLRGLLLRPLSAGLLRPTIPEEEGWVDRAKLLSIGGRGRKDQIAYANRHGLPVVMPGGGCLLTYEQTARRFLDLQTHTPDFSLSDFKLIAYGRHFRLSASARLVVARNDEENGVFDKLILPDDHVLMMADVLGPLGILRGASDPSILQTACAIFSRYSKARDCPLTKVRVVRNASTNIVSVQPARDDECSAARIF